MHNDTDWSVGGPVLTHILVMMSPLADHVNASICPGVSMKAYLHAVETSEVFENSFICIVCLVALHLLAGMRALFQELEHGSEACGEEIQRRHNSTIWTKVIPEHVGL